MKYCDNYTIAIGIVRVRKVLKWRQISLIISIMPKRAFVVKTLLLVFFV